MKNVPDNILELTLNIAHKTDRFIILLSLSSSSFNLILLIEI